jgi:hypothetical protein
MLRTALACCTAFALILAGAAYGQDRPKSLQELLEKARQQREQSGIPTPSPAGWPVMPAPQIQQTPQKSILRDEREQEYDEVLPGRAAIH